MHEHRIARYLSGFRWIRIVRIRRWLGISIRGSVQSEDIRSRLLVLQLIEESVRNVIPLVADAQWIGAALRNLTGPVIPPGLVRVTSQKVVIVKLHKVVRAIDRICRRRHSVIVRYRYLG